MDDTKRIRYATAYNGKEWFIERIEISEMRVVGGARGYEVQQASVTVDGFWLRYRTDDPSETPRRVPFRAVLDHKVAREMFDTLLPSEAAYRSLYKAVQGCINENIIPTNGGHRAPVAVEQD